MDRDERIKKLLDMQEHPELFSEQELEQMLHDTEAQELMEATALLKRAMKHDEFTMSGQETEDDWQHFAATHFARQAPRRSLFKVAASFIGILLIAGLSYAFYRVADNGRRQAAGGYQHSMAGGQRQVAVDSLVRFADVRLDSMLTVVAGHYGKAVRFRDDASPAMKLITRWNPADSLSAFIEHLNMFDCLHLTLEGDTIFVESASDEEDGL